MLPQMLGETISHKHQVKINVFYDVCQIHLCNCYIAITKLNLQLVIEVLVVIIISLMYFVSIF